MSALFRGIGAIVAALLLAFLLAAAVEVFSAVVHPVPPDFGGTMEEMCRHVERYPQWVLAVVVPAWAGTAFASSWTAGRIGNRGAALFVGLFLLVAAVFNITCLPYPIWFKVVSLILMPLSIAAGVYWSGRRNKAALSIAG